MWDLSHECLRKTNSEEQENKIILDASSVMIFFPQKSEGTSVVWTWLELSVLKLQKIPLHPYTLFYHRILFQVLASSFLKAKPGFALLSILPIFLPNFFVMCWLQTLLYIQMAWGIVVLSLLIAYLLDVTILASLYQGEWKRSHKAPLPTATQSQPCTLLWVPPVANLIGTAWLFHCRRCTGGVFGEEKCWQTGIN